MSSIKYSRDVEREALEFVKELEPDMRREDVKKLFEALQEEHALIESKLILIGTVYRSVLDEVFQQEDRKMGLPFGEGPIR